MFFKTNSTAVSPLPLHIVWYACRPLKTLARREKAAANFACRDVECDKQHLRAVKEMLRAAYKSQKVSKQTTRKPTVSLRTPTQMRQVLMSAMHGMNGTTCLQSSGRDTSTSGIVGDRKERADSPCPTLTGRD